MALDFGLSEEQLAIQQTTRDLFAPFHAQSAKWRESILERKEFPQEIWDALAEAGFMGCMIPEAYGGTEMGVLPLAFAVEEMAKLGFANPILILTTMDALCMVRTASEETKQTFLPKIATGEFKMAFALTEAEAGTNTFRITTSAKEEGDHYLINGSKTFITGADVADAMLVATRTKSRAECVAEGLPKSFGLSLFVVPTDAPGLRKDLMPTGGIEGMNQWTLFFDDVKVPKVNLVGDRDGGAMALFMALNPERILAAATAVGASEYALRLACDYARDRKVFRDTPIGAHQAIQHPLAKVMIRQEAARTMTYKAAWALDQNLPPNEAGFYANCAKYLASELGLEATDAAIQTLGGNGFSKEFGLLHLWTNLRLLKTAPISNEMILNYVAEHTLELPRSYETTAWPRPRGPGGLPLWRAGVREEPMAGFRKSEFEEEYDASLEGDEAEINGRALLARRIHHLEPAPAKCLEPDVTVQEAVDLMREHSFGCVLVVDDDALVGIFTERDVVLKCLDGDADLSRMKLSEVMTASPETLSMKAGIAYALNAMHTGGFRHIPVSSKDGTWYVVSVRDIVSWVVDLFPDAVLNLPPEERVREPGKETGG